MSQGAADDVEIRSCTPADEAAIGALWQRVFDGRSAWQAPDAILRRRARHRDLTLVAIRDGAVAGTVLGGWDGHRGWIYHIAVSPDLQRHGIGRMLMREIEHRLTQRDCPKINLQIEGHNRDVVGFYERLGYRVEDRISMGKATALAAATTATPAFEVGVYLPQVGFTWDELRDRVVACDRDGIHSVWFMDHLYPPELPAVPSFEAMTTATAVAAVTERIRIGHLVLCNGFRHPALLAKMATTLDHVSGGRFELGLGTGSYAPEFAAFGLPFDDAGTRAERLSESLQVIRQLFTDARVTFAGTHYRLDDAPSLPRPVQRPHPPIHVGGAGERFTLPLAARFADAWNCPTYALAAFPQKLERLRAECAAVGRDPATLRVTEEAVLALVPHRDQVDAARGAAERRFPGDGWGFAAGGYCGTPDDVVTRIQERRRAGVNGVVFFLADRGTPETLRLLAREVIPALASA